MQLARAKLIMSLTSKLAATGPLRKATIAYSATVVYRSSVAYRASGLNGVSGMGIGLVQGLKQPASESQLKALSLSLSLPLPHSLTHIIEFEETSVASLTASLRLTPIHTLLREKKPVA